MNEFCPNCEENTEQELINKTVEMDVRGELIPVHLEYHHCKICGADFELSRSDYDPLDQAFREYRRRKDMLQPEDIRKFRKEMGLTQSEFSRLLGIGIATLNRYENGALQSEAQDRSIRLFMEPQNLLHILKEKPEIISEGRRDFVYQRANIKIRSHSELLESAIEQFGNRPSDIFNGYTPFNIEKLFQVIKYFCYDDQVVKTKLAKLLFYADFHHFKVHGVSITGACFAHAPHGPLLDRFDTWLVAMSEWNNEITSEEQAFGDFIGEVYIAKEPDWAIFSASELASIAFVKDHFKHFSALQIRNFSHEEKGYINTSNGEWISYQYARELQI